MTAKCEWETPDGKEASLEVWGSDHIKKLYTYHLFSMYEMSMNGTVTGDTWTWTGQFTMLGAPVEERLTQSVLSPGEFTGKMEIKPRNGDWLTVCEFKATKID